MSEQKRVAFPLGAVVWNRLELDRAVRETVKPNLAQRLLEGELAKRPAQFDPFALGEVYGDVPPPSEGHGTLRVGFYARGSVYAARWNGTQWSCPAYISRIGSKNSYDLDYLVGQWNNFDLVLAGDCGVGAYLGDLATSTGQWIKP